MLFKAISGNMPENVVPQDFMFGNIPPDGYESIWKIDAKYCNILFSGLNG